MKICCAVFDSAVQAFGQPFFVAAAGAALRSFSDEVNRAAADNALYAHADDFELHQLCEFDEATGTMSGEGRILARAKDVKLNKE